MQIFRFSFRRHPLYSLILLFYLGVCFRGYCQNELKVLAYNIHHANPPSIPDSIDLPAIARVIQESGADLVALQEVDVYTQRSGAGSHQAKALAEMTGMHYYFEASISFQGGQYGNAILSRFPIGEGRKKSLTSAPGTEPRALLVVEVTLSAGEKIKFASTHLDFSSDVNAANQASDISAFFDGEELPVILAGDFNAEIGSAAIDELDGFFKRTCPEDCPPTIPVLEPRKAIDFIFYRPADKIQVKEHRVIDEKYASDHLPVLATLYW
ncbi:Metal-dependent hydrolase, endonuclease/exonuclease/phosphatase family [Cyclobacterium lianum]|uniref:Metal-dependent hydrolase, endonuclease/exonuclease/phosphatase family n=1 Tax=Cyclobacterium lianum TaxID=388280 RepID=A0A1M7QRW8_9BACT|nr:endonuclease/exonuclease/phosphatase family protein [Cyclobacterium lianum]SHN34057.1 Metal-dependent hydrolase, endonuclease/exonuclease/phosphatase family [Cyclobacterium lianum]